MELGLVLFGLAVYIGMVIYALLGGPGPKR